MTRISTEEHGRRVREGQAKSAKHQAHLARIAAAKEANALEGYLSAIFQKGRKLSAWEIICEAIPEKRPARVEHRNPLLALLDANDPFWGPPK